MEWLEYFQSHTQYFWQWEEQAEVIAIPGESTIAYRDYAGTIIERLLPQGIPPFGSLLLAIIATNPNASVSLDAVYSLVSTAIGTTDDVTLSDAISFLKMLEELPAKYKEGKRRLLLFQALFERGHNLLSSKNSAVIYSDFTNGQTAAEKLTAKKQFVAAVFNRDFRTISLLKNKFRDINAICERMAGMTEFKEELRLETLNEDTGDKDLIDELIENNKTFHIGSLVRRIWSGLNIPVHSSLPSQQPIGGVSDLTNKGDFDKLLLSEFANDDLVFLSRLANNEALYMNREIPPASNNLHRVILVDTSLKNWGTPKTIAFAVMMAIARHPKTNIACTAYAIGNGFTPIFIDNIDGIIDGFQVLEGSLHCAEGLASFFREFPGHKNREIFVISASSTLRQPAVLKAMNDFHGQVHYWIHTDADGNIDVYRKQQNGKKHLQHLCLPLTELWTKDPKKKEQIKQPARPAREQARINYPILFMNSQNPRKTISTENGVVFNVTRDKYLLRLMGSLDKPNLKGWDLLAEHLPFVGGSLEMGVLENEEYVLLMYNPQNNELTILNVTTGEKKALNFVEWKSYYKKEFFFYEYNFYYMNHSHQWVIDPVQGTVRTEKADLLEVYNKRAEELKKLQSSYEPANVLKNVSQVYINQVGNLVLNNHELFLNQGHHIKLEHTKFTNRKATAEKSGDNEFTFGDGSIVEINRAGMMILKSAAGMPHIYVPLVLDASLGAATEKEFAGNLFYHKERNFLVMLNSAGPSKLETIRLVKEHIGLGLQDCKTLVEGVPGKLLDGCPAEKAKKIKKQFENLGCRIAIHPLETDGVEHDQEVISTSAFFNRYIESFILNIRSHGTKN